jgi:predicted metal-binding protein
MHDRPDNERRIARVDRARASAALPADAERYAALALESGASRAGIVEPAGLKVDDRVALKCAVPKCFGYNTCANCPPHAPSPDQMRRLLPQYRLAVVLGVDMRPEAVVRDRETIEERVEAYKTVSRIVSALESAAFYDGHYLSAGFGAGSCKSTFCHKVDCAVLAGQKCRHNLVARPSMEAVGIDCFDLASTLGWEIFPVGSSAKAGQLPSGLLMGLVLVG